MRFCACFALVCRNFDRASAALSCSIIVCESSHGTFRPVFIFCCAGSKSRDSGGSTRSSGSSEKDRERDRDDETASTSSKGSGSAKNTLKAGMLGESFCFLLFIILCFGF